MLAVSSYGCLGSPLSSDHSPNTLPFHVARLERQDTLAQDVEG